MTNILIRTLIIYIFLISFIRFTGKRQIGELQLSELVTTFLLSELAALPITDSDIPLLHAIAPIVFLMSLEVIISFFVTKFAPLKKFFDGTPSILVRNGSIDKEELTRQRVSIEELICALRQQDKPDISEISYVFLEPNGQITAFDKKSEIMFPIIVDGKIVSSSLSILGISNQDVKNRIDSQKCGTSSIFFYGLTASGKEYIVKSNSK